MECFIVKAPRRCLEVRNTAFAEWVPLGVHPTKVGSKMVFSKPHHGLDFNPSIAAQIPPSSRFLADAFIAQ